jgi:hypothetical protein
MRLKVARGPARDASFTRASASDDEMTDMRCPAGQLAIEPAGLMTRRMVIGLKQWAEALRPPVWRDARETHRGRLTERV